MTSHTCRGTRSGAAVLGSLLGLLLALGACGSDSEEATSSSSSRGDAAAELAAAEERIAELRESNTDLPTEPTEPQPGKSVWAISCGNISSNCSGIADNVAEAGDLMGWDVKTFDGKLDAATQAAGIRQAVAADADAIVLVNIDCQAVKAPLQEADDAGVIVYANTALDCGDTQEGEPNLFDGQVIYQDDLSYKDWLAELYGTGMAELMIAGTEGEAKVVMWNEEDIANVKILTAAFVERMEQCETCEIVAKVDIVGADLANPDTVSQKIQAVMARTPDANGFFFPFDQALDLGGAAGLAATGRVDDLYITGGQGLNTAIDRMREGTGQNAFIGEVVPWIGYASVDGLNRIFAGQEQIGTGIGVYPTTDENLPDDIDSYQSPPGVDWKANYLSLWGVA